MSKMSEDKKKKSAELIEYNEKNGKTVSTEENSSRAITRDEQNAASATAGKLSAREIASAGADDLEPDDEILKIIRERRVKTVPLSEEVSDADEAEEITDQSDDVEISEPDTEDDDPDDEILDIIRERRSRNSVASEDIQEEEDTDTMEELAAVDDTGGTEESDISDGQKPDAEELTEDDIQDSEETQADEGSDFPDAADAESQDAFNAVFAAKAPAPKKVSKDGKRYGFKPYTMELEKVKELEEAAAAAEKGGGKGKMAKGSGKGKTSSKKSGASGSKSKSTSAKPKAKNPKGTKSVTTSKSSGTGKKSGAAASSAKTAKSAKPAKTAKPAVQSQAVPPKKRSKLGIFFKAFFVTILICVMAAGIAGAAYTAYVISHADNIHPRNIYDTLDVSTHIYDDKERLVDEIYFSENREIVSFEQLPENLTNAFIAVEDKTFWTHKGFNFRRIIGAILERFHGGRISGTSTITQQLARNVFLPEDKSVRSIKRKIIEMYYAYEIEQELSKEEIITAYLNTIYLGYGCYGVDTAAKTYFSCNVEDLTLEQCAALAALPQAPGSYSLLVNEPTDTTVEYKKGIYINDASRDRRNMILNLMFQQGMITEEEKDAATRPLEEFIKPGSTDEATSQSAFKDYLIETVKKDLMNEYGIEEEQAIKIIYTKGLNIYTTMDSQAQRVITKQFKNKENFPTATKKGASVESAMVVTEVGTGEIKAMVGTRNVTGQMLFNRATNPRQPGSSIKPLSVYSAALEKSLEYQKDGKIFKFKDTGYDRQGKTGWGDYITVSSKVIDEKMTVNGKTWPLNVTRTYSGLNTFRTAIQKSINTCAVKILAQIGIEYSMDTLKRFGITTAIDDSSASTNDLNYAALGLGAMSYGISPLEMSVAYAVFPNGGIRNTPIIYTKVEDSSGRTLLEGKSETVKVLDEGVAWIMTDVLKSVVKDGIAQDAAVSGIEVGGKTGTTDDRYDIWFNGFTPTYSVALWIGTDDNVQMDSYSDKAAALWSNIVSRIKRADGGTYKSMPDNVSRAWNGEYYTKGTAPPEPPPEPEVKDEDDKSKKGKSGGKTDAKKPAGKTPAPAPAATPAPADNKE